MKNALAFESWGKYPIVEHLGEIVPQSIEKVKDEIGSVGSSVLPRGLGRSYGDSCLNEGGYLLSSRSLNKFQNFDPATGILRCESGVTLEDILKVFVPKGWFLMVTPGTKFVTVGGAIANDVHGKNHHKIGSFGNHVKAFELQRSDGSSILCSKDDNPDWFSATIGGLGLTGVILWAEIQLRPIKGPYVDMESIKFSNLDEFLQISKESEEDYEYVVSWLDCLNDNIRGLFMRGNHSDKKEEVLSRVLHKSSGFMTFPFDAPSFLLSKASIKAFNYLYYNKQRKMLQGSTVHYDPFFYPLDKINNWNRMYGKRGFLQWQCAVSAADDNRPIRMILEKITRSGLGSFLVVLKEFGNMPPAGMLSFPMPGITLAIDFPNVGIKLYSLLDELDEIVNNYSGRLYPAKDARMAGSTFFSSFKEWSRFSDYIDPKFSSSFYRRVKGA
jgi:FAD/FMN-containing dehydrogenase